MTMVRNSVRDSAVRLLVGALSVALVTVLTGGTATAAGASQGEIGILATDVYIRDHPTDVGLEPSGPYATYWDSPDVKICPVSPCAGGAAIPAGSTSHIFVSLRNPGPYGSGLDNGTLRVYLTYLGVAATWPTQWTPLTSSTVPVPPGVTTLLVPWTPPSTGIATFLFRWESPDDPTNYPQPNAAVFAWMNNNVALEAVQVI